MENGVRGIGPTNSARLVNVLGGTTDEYLTRPARPEIEELKQRMAELEARVAKLEAQ
jgi:5'-3' exonuclease